MKIAYISSYLSKCFREKYCSGTQFALSGIFKSQGIARALMAAGHDVTIFSSGITTCGCKIKSFSEIELFPEGKLKIEYPTLYSYRKCSPINAFTLRRKVCKYVKIMQFDIVVYYNITLDAVICIPLFQKSVNILEYEDNIFNKALVGDKSNFVWFKTLMYNYLIKRTTGLMAVCVGMISNNKVKHKILTPGIIDEDVINNISQKTHLLQAYSPVKIVLTGGVHYSKGPDLLINALQFVDYPCEVHFFSNGNFYSGAIEAVKSVPARHKVVINGYMEHKKLIQFLTENDDILINTTRNMGVGTQNAGFPFKMMEYATVGRPIVSSSIGRLDEEFNSHITYYDDDTPENVAAAINYVIYNYKELTSKALELQKLVIQRYSIEGVAKTLKPFIEICTTNDN